MQETETHSTKKSTRNWLILLVILGVLYWGWHNSNNQRLQREASNRAELRRNLILEDDPETTNDESNDQPEGYYGSETITACTPHNGSCYDLDADIEDTTITTIYFPKGGYVYVNAEDCNSGETCYGEDGDGTEWELTRP